MGMLFVQFIHPGIQPTCHGDSGVLSWNTKEFHKRKLIRHNIKYWDQSSSKEVGPEMAYFWGEWEASSSWRKGTVDPCANEHKIIIPEDLPDSRMGHQNTDPNVFGKRFVYTLCHQKRYSSLRDLDPGSIIAFGSYDSCRKRFVMDTLFLVGQIRTFLDLEKETWRGVVDSEVYRKVTIWPLKDLDFQPTVYGAVMASDAKGTDSAFSFIPCCRKPFDRPPLPSLEKTGVVSPGLRQGIKRTPMSSFNESMSLWHMVKQDVLSAGLSLGTSVIM